MNCPNQIQKMLSIKPPAFGDDLIFHHPQMNRRPAKRGET